MRILFAAAETTPPTYPSVTGIFGQGLVDLGHDVVGLFYDEEGPPGSTWPGEILKVPRPRRRPLQRMAASLISEWQALDRVLASARPFDAVIVRDDPIMALAALRWRHRHPLVVYQVSHLNAEEVAEHARDGIYGRPLLNTAKAWGMKRLRDRALGQADHAIVMTVEMRAALALDGRRCTVVGEGVSRDWTPDLDPQATRARHDLPAGAPLVVYAGTFNRVRHLEVLVDAHRRLREEVPEAVLVLAGSGREPEDERFLREYARAASAETSVRFLGWLPHARVASLFDASDAVISSFPATPVLRCNSPTRLFEAMHRARPVVAGDIPEQRRVIEASQAGIVVRHAPDDIASACARLVRDAALRARMGGLGRAWVLEHRTYDHLARTVDETLRSLAASGGRELGR